MRHCRVSRLITGVLRHRLPSHLGAGRWRAARSEQGAVMTDPQVTGGLSRPLAAYRLGLLSHTYPIWRRVSLNVSVFEGCTPDCDVFPFEQLHRAIIAL